VQAADITEEEDDGDVINLGDSDADEVLPVKRLPDGNIPSRRPTACQPPLRHVPAAVWWELMMA
jgi:hypothetical protein